MKLLNRQEKTCLKAFFRGVFLEGKPRDQEASRKREKKTMVSESKKTMKMGQKDHENDSKKGQKKVIF